ncbi:MAG: sigma-70 family RNA polymerase sigma factor, partial [Pseudomonadota bacterium]
AEDVLQETFVEVIRSIANFRGEAALGTWIRHIAVSKSLMLLRSAWERRSMQMPEAAEDQLRAPAQQLDDAKDLAQALGTLEPQSRVVVWLHDVEGYTHKEIAELMDKTVAFSKSRLSRAHASLRSLLNANETEFTGAALKPC